MVRTLLLTDIVDSTQMVRELGDTRAAEVFALHDRLSRDLLPGHRGREIDKTDGFLMLFETPQDGLDYALAYHASMRQLSRELGVEVRARAGLHTAEVVLRENPASDVALGAKPLEVDGIAKPTAARIMSLASGGQTLLSQSARQGTKVPEGAREVSHGYYRVKGLEEPIELFEVGAPEFAPLAPPPDSEKVHRVVFTDFGWQTLNAVPNNLPAPRDRFFGRTRELRLLADRAERSGLVSVVGLGGLGKSRLVLEYARTFMGDFPGGVWWCATEGRQDVEGVCRAVASAMDIPLTAGDPVERVGKALAGKRSLVVLDSGLPSTLTRETVGVWRRLAPKTVFVLAALGPARLSGEQVLLLGPLEVPSDANVFTPAVALFLDRARAVKPQLQVDPGEVLQLVRGLDGLPLAIELAAARVRVMTPRKILERLSRRFDLLKGRDDTTLRGVLDVSWEQLGSSEQAALAQCTVFAGGWSLEAAEEVLSLGEEDWPLDVLDGLAQKGLVRALEVKGEVRFSMLRSISEYAAEKLADEGVRARHAAFFADSQCDARELDNLLAATRFSLGLGDTELATDCCVRASRLLRQAGPLSVALELGRRVLELVPAPAGRARLLYERCLLLATSNPAEAERALDLALGAARVSGDQGTTGELLGTLANLQLQRGRVGIAEATFDAALGLLPPEDTRRGSVLGNRALLQMRRGRVDEALVGFQQALVHHHRARNHRSAAMTMGNMGVLHRRLGNTDQARELMVEALVLHRKVSNRGHEAAVLGSLGLLLLEEGDLGAAAQALEQAVAIQRGIGNRRGEGIAMGNLGSVQLERGDLPSARRWLSSAIEALREARVPRAEGAFLGTLAEVERRAGQLDEARLHIGEAEGLLRRAEDRSELAKVLCRRGQLDLDQRLGAQARGALDEARQLSARMGPDSEVGRLVTQLAERVG